jgi:hypothetical protein
MQPESSGDSTPRGGMRVREKEPAVLEDGENGGLSSNAHKAGLVPDQPVIIWIVAWEIWFRVVTVFALAW